jgi:hypothetical protein
VTGCGRIAEDDEGSGGTSADDAATGAQASTGGSGDPAGGSPSETGGSGGTGLILVPNEPVLTGWDWWIEYELKEGPNEDDDRPERPADHSLGLELGELGWQGSTTPLCTGMTGVARMNVWADAEGVAILLHADECSPFLEHECAVHGSEVWYNQGSGWSWLIGFSNKDVVSSNLSSLAGLVGGDLLVGASEGVLALGRQGGFWQTESTTDPAGLVDDRRGGAYSAFMEVGTLDIKGPPPFHVAAFDGATWKVMVDDQHEEFTRLRVIDGTPYLVTNQMYRLTEGELEALPELPGGTSGVQDLLGTAADDLYAFASGLEGTLVLHLEGGAWTAIAMLDSAIVDGWADGDGAYLVTEKTFGRVSASGFEPLATLGDGTAKFTSIHGVSATEIFLAALDTSLYEYACDAPFLLHWDGAELHRF